MRAWILLLIAGAFEICWPLGLKYSQGFTKALPTALTVAALIASFVLLGLAARTLPIGTAYAVWTGIGATGTAVLGILLFGDPATPARIGCILLIVTGVMGLKFLGSR